MSLTAANPAIPATSPLDTEFGCAQTMRSTLANLPVTHNGSVLTLEVCMTTYRHHVSGFFPNRTPADTTMNVLLDRGFSAAQLQIFSADSDAPPTPEPLKQSNTVLKDMLVDGSIGAVIGTSLGGLTTVALVAANVSVFVASPLLAPLMLLGWGASLGALTGAVVGASEASGEPQGRFAELIMTAIQQGDVVLVVETNSEAQTAIAREVIAASVGQFKDLNMLESIPTHDNLAGNHSPL